MTDFNRNDTNQIPIDQNFSNQPNYPNQQNYVPNQQNYVPQQNFIPQNNTQQIYTTDPNQMQYGVSQPMNYQPQVVFTDQYGQPISSQQTYQQTVQTVQTQPNYTAPVTVVTYENNDDATYALIFFLLGWLICPLFFCGSLRYIKSTNPSARIIGIFSAIFLLINGLSMLFGLAAVIIFVVVYVIILIVAAATQPTP